MSGGIVSQDQDHIYYNFVIANNTNGAIQAQYTDFRSQALILSPEEWYVSIIRFDVPGSGVPINNLWNYVMPYSQINPLTGLNNTDPNILKLSVTLKYGNLYYQQPLRYVS